MKQKYINHVLLIGAVCVVLLGVAGSVKDKHTPTYDPKHLEKLFQDAYIQGQIDCGIDPATAEMNYKGKYHD